MRRTSTAASSRSPRCLGNTLARLGEPTWCPARPARCSPRATVVGDSTMTTRSTAAMSMPSSRDEVAATARSAPVFRPSSMARRCSRDTEPWWALTISSPARALSWAARRSTRVRLFEKMIVERWARTSSRRRGYIAGQMERRGGGVPGSGGREVALGPGHVLDRDDDLQVEPLVAGGIDDGHRPGPPGAAGDGAAAEEAGDGLEGALGGGEADALRRGLGDLLEALQREGEVGAALGAGHGVDLVDDDPAHRGEDLPGRRGEQQVEALRGGDQDVGGVAQHGPPLLGRRVAGAHGRGDLEQGGAAFGGGPGDAAQRRPQVALDVVGQGLEGGDVEQAAAAARRGRGRGEEAVEAPEEGGQGLARPGGGVDQHVAPGGDGRPALLLGGGGRGEGGAEPLRHRGGEQVEGRHEGQRTGAG